MSNKSTNQLSDNGASCAGLGWLLMLPGLLAWLVALVAPSLDLFRLSLLDVSLVGQSTFVGLRNYQALSTPQVQEALNFTLLVAAVRLAVMMLVPLVLALAINEFGRVVRAIARLVTTVPLALFAPAAALVAWRTVATIGQGLPLVEHPRRTLLLIDSAVTFGLVCGLGLIFYLAALRGSGDDPPRLRDVGLPLVVTWAVGVIAVFALSLQTFALSLLLTGGQFQTGTLATTQYDLWFRFLDFGASAALAFPLLLVLSMLGLIAGAIVVFARLRLETVPSAKTSQLLGKGIAAVVFRILAAIVALNVVIQMCSLTTRPVNALEATQARPADPPVPVPVVRTTLSTLLPSLIGVLVLQIPFTYLTALAIGALRSLGKHSELLLLLFAPWLFVTSSGLSLVFLRWRIGLGLAGTLALIPPVLVNVPVLFVLTLYFKGHESKWQNEGPESGTLFQNVVLPSLPLTALLALVALHASMQDVFWSLTLRAGGVNPRTATLSTALFELIGRRSIDLPLLSRAVLLLWMPVSVVFLLLYGVLQVTYLDRLALVRESD